MRKNFYSATAIVVTLLLAAGAFALAGERDLRQSEVGTDHAVQTAGNDDAVEASARATARMLVAAAANAENPQEAMRYLNQVFGLNLPGTAKTLAMAHQRMAELLVDAPALAEQHRQMGLDVIAARRAAIQAGAEEIGRRDQPRTMINEAATILRLSRHASSEREAMIWLQRALDLDLPANDPQAGQLRYTAHIALAGFTNAPSKRAHHLTQAAQYVTNPAERARLEAEIEMLGGAPVVAGPGSPEASLTPGLADNCFDGTVVPTFNTDGEFYSDGLSISAMGDRDWYTVTVDTGSPVVGLTMRIETISDTPGTPEDDTRLWLYTDCDGTTGEGDNLIEFDDDSGEGFMSLIDTECLANGTYYLKVNGWEEVSLAENITLEIETTTECVVVAPDAFEPDDDRATAAELTAGAAQSKSIAPEGNDDWNWFDMGEARMMRISTSGADVNTALALFYASPNVPVVGLCNSTGDPDIPPGAGLDRSITNGCNADADCPDNINPVPGEPDCLLWESLPPEDRLINPVDNVLAVSAQGMPGGPSALTMCLPTTMRPSQSESVDVDPADPFHWYVRTSPGRPDVKFDYEILLEDIGPCGYETASNNTLATASELASNGKSYGIFDYSAFPAAGDKDFFSFDVAGFGPWGVSINSWSEDVDSFIEMWVGPDDNGDYFLVATDDNSGPGKLSRIDLEFGPAADSIPNPTEETSYFVNVTAVTVGPNFPYEVKVAWGFGDFEEDPDNEYGDCDLDTSLIVGGASSVDAAIDFECDYDGVRFSIAEDRVMRIVTDSDSTAGDTVIQLVECGTDNILACDEDSNTACASAYCSQIDGCLAGGVDYCVRVRAFSGNPFDYVLDILDDGPCTATEPPELNFDGIGQCRDDGLGDPRFNNTACTSDYTYSECAGAVVEPPVMCEDAGGFPQCDLPCPNPDDVCTNMGDFCQCEPPLLVTMVSMSATASADGVVISWTTATEVDTVGFQILREDLGSREKAGRKVVITNGLIPSAGNQVEGATYSFIDGERRGAKSVNYYIRDIDAFGRATEHGPIIFVPSNTRTSPAQR